MFIQAVLRNMLAPVLTFGEDMVGSTAQPFVKLEKQLIRYAIRNNRIVRPAEAAKEMELHKQTVIKYCRELVHKGKLRPVPAGPSGKIYQYEYLGAIQSSDLL